MVKRKNQGGDDMDGDRSVPLPIQTFFWRQTSPFIRPKQSNLCEASCLSFERVVVQNILHGLSPSLCKAVQSVSRWKVVQAAFPHLMHACSSLVSACKQGNSDNRFGSSETKLLYTLHWIILDAASECEDADAELMALSETKNGSTNMHSLSTIQLFVYLFAPLVHLMKDSDFESLKLENGLRLWQPLWEFQQPDIPCFATPVKPQRSVLKAQRSQLKMNTNAANIYVGKGTSRENLACPFDEVSSQISGDEGNNQPAAPLARLSDICTLSTAESQTATMEVICENCNTVMPVKNNDGNMTCRCGRRDTLVAFLPDSNNYAFLKLTSCVDKDYVKQKLASAVTSGTRGPGAIDILSASYLDVAVLRCLFCLSWSEDGIYWALRYMHQRMLEVCHEFAALDQKERARSCSLPIPDLNILMAGSTTPTPASGLHSPGSRHSSGSNHFSYGSSGEPHIQSPTMKHVPGLELRRSAMTSGDKSAFSEVQHHHARKEPPFKKIRGVELKQFFDSGKSFLRKRDQHDHDAKDDSSHDLEGDGHRTALGIFKEIREQDERFGNLISSSSRRSLPAGNQVHQDKDSVGSSSQCSGQDSSASSQVDLGQGKSGLASGSASGQGGSALMSGLSSAGGDTTLRKPIIRITEHSPEARDDFQSSNTMPRSFTDSNIAYKQDNEVTEVSGSKHYIQDNGHLQYKVVLRALHFVAMNEHAPRICEVLLNLLHCLLDLDIIEVRRDTPSTPSTSAAATSNAAAVPTTASNKTSVATIGSTLVSSPSFPGPGGATLSAGAMPNMFTKTPGSAHSGPSPTTTPEGSNNATSPDSSVTKDEVTAHGLAMDSLFRIYKALGCPHGCNDGVMGSQGEHLRQKAQNCLQRLHKLNPAMFHKFMRDTVKKRPLQESVDFLHAFLGFCFDPATLVQSPMSQKKSISQENIPRTGYSNNFGHSVGGEGYRGVEGVLIANLAKPLVSRCVECASELYGTENIGLFCDVRQMMAYVKEIHGGTFRRVALSGLLDSLQKVKRESVERKRELTLKKQSSPVRRTTSVTSESGDERESSMPTTTKHISVHHHYNRDDESSGRRKSKKSLFRNKITKSLMFQYAASDSEILDDGPGKSPRTSISAAEDESPSSGTTPRRRFSKFNIGWRRGTKSDHEDEQMSDPPPLDRRESRSEIQVHRNMVSTALAAAAAATTATSTNGAGSGGVGATSAGSLGVNGAANNNSGGAGRGRMSFKAASQATLTFLSARKKLEDGIKTLGKKMTRKSSCDDFFKQRSGVKSDNGVELVLVKEKKMVDRYLVKSGMLRFSFLLECCHPGSLPDPQLVAAMLDLEAPVCARAAMLLECAHFIHRCNRGDWPNWMKLNLPSFRHTVAALQNRGQPSGYRRNIILQKAAGRMFYSWAENLGLQMEYILAKEHADRLAVIDEVKDENRKKELRAEDEDEDFLDEASVNQKGKECPYALKMLACLVLVEVTTFLRETFQYLPRSRSHKREHLWEKNVTSRRYSSIVSSPGHSDKSSESNVAELPAGISNIGSPGDRKISFAVLTERSDSLHSSTASLSQLEPGMEEKKEKGRRLAQGRQKLLRHFRRGSGHNLSFRRSFKLSRPDSGGGSIKQHGGSIKSRKISSHSLQSDAKYTERDDEPLGSPTLNNEDTESVTMMSDDTNQESPVEKDAELEDEHLYTNLPWIKVVVQLANLSNFICPHHNYCHPNCYERQRRSCSRLITALRKIYDSTEEDEHGKDGRGKDSDIRDKLRRRESVFQVTSPTSSGRRRESTPLLEKIKTDVSMTKLKLSSNSKKDDKPREAKEDPPIVKYLTSQAQRLTQCPMAILTKAAPVLNVEHFIDIMPVAWELMLESDQELAAAAASVFLLSSAKSSDKARNMIIKEMQHEETNQRINAVLRFGALWKFRYQVWPRMEDGANMYFKLPPPSIDFTLPSPCIGLPSLTVVDPPWMPHFKTNIEEVTVNQEETKSLVTATTTRRKQQQEMIRKALLAEEERKRVGRENFPMTTVPVTVLAAYEPLLHHGDGEHEEVAQEEMTLAARRVSLAPTNRANNQSRSMSWRNGSLHWDRLAGEGDEDRLEHGQHLQTAQSVFPSCICAAVLPVLHLLDDHEVNADGVSVAEVAYKVIWDCIVDDPILFLRHFLEKLTNKERQEELMFLLRKLILYFPQMPAQAAHSIFNYLVGYIMFYVRTPCEGGQDAISGALSLLWLSIPSVEGIYFKDLKQTLKKEQCDPFLLVSASVASAKKILVHGPDLSSIPSQLPIHEDTQFFQILQESLEFFNIPEDQHNSHFLVDTKTHQIHNSSAYVRDFYFFRRNFYPQLSLVRMNPDDATLALQRRVFMLKFVEVGKVLLTNAVMEHTPPHQMQNHVSFLHEELSKLPSFPRKALEAEFDMYSGGWGKEIFGMDSLHKYSWAKLMSTIFSSMSSTFTWSNDLNLFIHVLNGTIVLQFEDTAILRFCLATLINTSRHFKHIFATNGFLHIMPTLVRVYSNNQPNPVLQNAIQFVCKQFYILHRKPFILQMFGSVAPILDMTCAASGVKDCTKVQPDSLFKLLLSLEKECPDHLSVLDLVVGEKPLKALDFCYENDPDTFNMMDVINMCVTVIAYSPDSYRSGQMLTILEMVIPRYLDHLKKETTKKDNSTAARAEVTAINSLAVAVRALVTCCESFARNMSMPQRYLEASNPTGGNKPTHNHSIHSLTVDDREDSHTSRHNEDGRRKTFAYEPEDLELRDEFRKPRDSLLSVSAEFYTRCHARLKELRKMLADPAFRPPELFDNKAHNRLAEVAHTLLKLAPYDPVTMACTGLQRYMLEILPNTDWSHELNRPGLNLILRRLDRLFTKISKKSALRRPLDWEAAANILKGVYQTLRKFSFVALLPHLKTLVNILITILLTSTGSGCLLPESLTNPGSGGGGRGEYSGLQTDASPMFVSSVVKLVAMQMQALGDQYSLEQICGGVSAFCANEKSLNLLINFILPLCIRVGSHTRDTPRMSQTDITFVLTVVTNLLSPGFTPANLSHHQSQQNSVGGGGITGGAGGKSSNYLSISEQGRSSSVSHSWDGKPARQTSELHHQTALLGLEIMMVCFDKQLASQWHQVAKAIMATASKGKVDLSMWKFLDFLVTHRPSLFILLQTFIQFRMMRVNCDTAQEYYLQQTIRDKLQGYTFSYHKSASAILVNLAVELRHLRDELASSVGAYRSRAATSVTEHSEYSQAQYNERMPNCSITEIAAEIIGPTKASHASLIKRSSRTTLFSQSSSTGSAPPPAPTQPQQRSHSHTGALISTDTSPTAAAATAAVAAMAALHRSRSTSRSSKRITAREGSRILDKFVRKKEDTPDIPMPHSPLLHRQGTIRFRGNLSASKQNSFEKEGSLAQVVYENEDGEADVIETEADGAEGLTPGGDDPRGHRLQRADAKSRKTFKIKRVKTKSSVRPRFMSHRRRPDNSSGAGSDERGDNSIGLTHTAVVLHDHRGGQGLRRPGAGGMARSVETIPESMEVKQSARSKMLQRSKSHDEPSGDPLLVQRDRDKPSHSSTRTGRIHRKGGRIVHSRSPSVSPSLSPRPSYHRKKQKDHLDSQNLHIQALEASAGSGDKPKTCSDNKDKPIQSKDQMLDMAAMEDSSRMITEQGLRERLVAVAVEGARRKFGMDRGSLDTPGSPLTSPVSPEESSLGGGEVALDSKTTSTSFVSFSSLDTVVSLVDQQAKDGSVKCVTSPLPNSPAASPAFQADSGPVTTETPTRRMAIRLPQGRTPDLKSRGPTSPPAQLASSFALEQIKGYGSPAESPVSAAPAPSSPETKDEVKTSPTSRENRTEPAPIPRPQYPSSIPTLAQAHGAGSPAIHKPGARSNQYPVLTSPVSPRLSPISPPAQQLSHSAGSSSQNSPSHVTSFSSSPNDSPIRKPSFSSSATSPTRHYSSSSTMDSPTHKLFVSYRNSPSHRSGAITSPTLDYNRKTSFSSSSHGSPVRKPSFSSSSESQQRQNYSSTTSSQSSLLSSPTHASSNKGYAGSLSPKETSPLQSPLKGPLSPSRSPQLSPTRLPKPASAMRERRIARVRSPLTSPVRQAGNQDVVKYGRPPSPKLASNVSHQHAPAVAPKPSRFQAEAEMRKIQPPPPSSTAKTGGSHQIGLRYTTPPKPASLKLREDTPKYTGLCPLSSPDPEISEPSYLPPAKPKVQGLVSKYEHCTAPGARGSEGQTVRQGGPQSAAVSATPPSGGTGSSDPWPGTRLSPPAYTYTSPLPSSRSGSSSRLSSQPSPSLSLHSSHATPSPHPSSGPLSPPSRAQSQQYPSASLSPMSSSWEHGDRLAPVEDTTVSSAVYVARCDSSDSLSANETSSLLRDEEKSDSMSSLYYADEDIPDAV